MNIVNLFYPGEKIAGLAISDSSLRLLLFHKTDSTISLIVQAGVRLAPSILENGEVKDKEGLISALKKIKEKAGGYLDKTPYAIVSLPPEGIYSKVFQFPNLNPEQIKDAMNLNISTVLPVAPSDTYLDWQEQSEFQIDSVISREVLLEAVRKERADAYIDALNKAGFMALAFESPSQSLARLVENFEDEAGLIAYLNEEGINLVITQKNFVRFNRFVAWSAHLAKEKEAELTRERILDVLAKEINLTVNFFQSEHKETVLKKFTLLAPEAVKAGILDQLQTKTGLEHQPFKLKIHRAKNFPLFDDSWLIAVGTALRGLIPRVEDAINSLMPVGTEAAYAKRKFVSYFTLWSDIIAALSIAIMILFVGSHFFLNSILTGVDRQLETRGIISGPVTLGDLEQKAAEINEKLKIMVPAAENANFVSPVIEKILALAPPGINLTQLGLSSLDQPISITGIASSRDAALLFKNKLENSPDFSDVNLPLGSLVQTQNILFTISFKWKAR